jgi:hypothetical protein
MFQTLSLGIFFFSNKRKQKKTKKKKTIEKKKMQRREGVFLQALALPSHFWVLLLPSHFKCFFWHLLLFKHKKRKENHREEKNAEKGRSFPLNSALAFHFWFPLLPFCFCPFVSNTFSWHLLFLKQKKRKEKQRKKNHREEKNVEKEGSLLSNSRSTLSFLAFTFGLLFLAFCFKHFLLASFSSQHKEKKNHREKRNVKKKGSLPFFFRFYIWDEAFLLLSPFHIPLLEALCYSSSGAVPSSGDDGVSGK